MDPSTGQHQEMGNPKGEEEGKVRPPAEEAVKCPRCDSGNTKFCYYNNYSLSQPRYFCKSCKRYWTKGGTLRNVPVGGRCRKNKISASSSSSKRTQDQTLTPNINRLIKTHPIIPLKETQPQQQFKSIIPPSSFDHNHIDTTNDPTLAFSGLQKHYDHHVLGNPSLHVTGSVANPGFLGNLNNSQVFGTVGPSVGFDGETMMLYNNEDMIDSTAMTTTTTTTLDVAVPTMKQDSTDNRSVLWGLPWQLIADAGDNNNHNNMDMAVPADFDSVGDNRHGLL